LIARRALGVGDEVSLVHAAAEGAREQLQEGRPDGVAALAPERVGDPQLSAVAGRRPLAHLRVEDAHGDGEAARVQGGVQDMGDLVGGSAACAGQGHGEHGRQAGGGCHEVVVAAAEMPVEGEGERGRAAHSRGHV